MLAWMCLGGLAAAASQQEALDYMDTWRGLSDANAALEYRYSLSMLVSSADTEQSLNLAQVEAQRLLAVCEQTPVWADDKGLSAAVTAQVASSLHFHQQTMPTLLSFVDKAEPRDADQLQFEALLDLSLAAHASDWDRVDVALRAFGAAHRIVLMDGKRYPVPPPLEVELPGSPSALSKSWRLNFAVGHYNEALTRYDRNVDLWDKAVGVQSPEELAALRPELLAASAQSDAFPPWMGDETLSFAIAQAGEDLVGLWETLSEVLVLQQRNILFRRHREQQDVLLDGIQDQAYKMDGAFERRLKRFSERWHFEEYTAYGETLDQWVQQQGDVE